MRLNRRRTLGLTALLATLALAAAACGSTGTTQDTTTSDDTTATDDTTDDTGELPPAGADEAGDPPAVTGVCAPDEPDCEDTIVVDPDVGDLPSTRDEEPTTGAARGEATSGFTIDGGLTISEALATSATGILAVKGHLFDDGTGAQLCEGLVGLGDSYGCDGAHISVTNLDLDTVGSSLVVDNGVTYTKIS